MIYLYGDGGCIGRNERGGGSRIGGTWAYRIVTEHGPPVGEGGAMVLSSVLHDWVHAPTNVYRWLFGSRVSNNQMELYALLKGLRALQRGIEGATVLGYHNQEITVCSDSGITLGRLFHGWAWAGIPTHHRELVERLVQELPIVDHVLLAGHPTALDLKRGYKLKTNKAGETRQVPVSEHNMWCDKEAARMGNAALYYMRHHEQWPGLPALPVHSEP